jgi:hypothetical protein
MLPPEMPHGMTALYGPWHVPEAGHTMYWYTPPAAQKPKLPSESAVTGLLGGALEQMAAVMSVQSEALLVHAEPAEYTAGYEQTVMVAEAPAP